MNIALVRFLGVASIGLLFGAYLFNEYHEIWEDRRSGHIRNLFVILTALCFVSMIGIRIHDTLYIKSNGFVEYTLKLYYLGGSQDVKTFVTYPDDYPYISSYKGSYTLSGMFKSEPGVVRFEVVSKKNISAEEFERKYGY